MKISLLLIGDELLNGSREDINAHLVIKELKKKGHVLNSILICGDDIEQIAKSISFLLKNNDFIISSGGLGLTPDDVTVEAIAKGIGRKIVLSEKAKRAVKQSLKRIGRNINAALEDDFSKCIEGAEIIENETGVAPIEKIRIKRKMIYVLPGVPIEFETMFKKYVLKDIPNATHKEKEVTINVNSVESNIVDILRNIQKLFAVKTYSYPPIEKSKWLTIKLMGKNADRAFEYLSDRLEERGIEFEKDIS